MLVSTTKTDEVFGISRDVPKNYVARELVDQVLIDNLTRKQHIVIHGGSKQGKTCPRKYCLNDSDYILIQCSNKWVLSDLHSSILKRAGFETEQSTTKTATGKQKVIARFNGFIFGVGAGLDGEKENSTSTSNTTTPLEIDIEDVNDVISALKSISFEKFIVLEDFHYLTQEVQYDFAVALKAFHESSSICFIVVGVWLDENRLIVYNGDLTGRVFSVNADEWTRDQLREVVQTGGRLLNVVFEDAFVNSLINESFDSVHIVQEVCRSVCRHHRIFGTQSKEVSIGSDIDAKQLVAEVMRQHGGRYDAFLRTFSDGFQDTELQMYKWLLYPILTSEISVIRNGLLYSDIRSSIQKKHPSGAGLNPGNITQALQSTASLQIKKDVKPLVLDYDQTNRRLHVVDRGFLIWMQSQNVDDLLSGAGIR